MNKTFEGHCSLCGRFATTLYEHHLIPRSTHGTKRVVKMFGKTEPKTRKEMFCHPCHKAAHAFFTNKELALEFNTVKALKADPKVQRHIEWVRKQRPAFKSKGRRSC